jgi:hypothetical protein
MPEGGFREAFDRLESYVESRWGVPVVLGDVPAPFLGDLDGAEIRIDHEVSAEEAVFLVAHLFGHTVQWNTNPRARAIGRLYQGRPSPAELAEIEAYERDACRYGLALFHDAGVRDLDAWLSDFAACDFAHLRHFYLTGERRPYRDFWRDGAPLLDPLAIPEFHPTRWIARSGGVVI